jgi:TPR repeat protein
MACDKGSESGCLSLGNTLIADESNQAQLDEAFAIFKKTCDADYADGCVLLAGMHRGGIGRPTDEATAKALYEKACKAGSPQGCAGVDPKATDADKQVREIPKGGIPIPGPSTGPKDEPPPPPKATAAPSSAP